MVAAFPSLCCCLTCRSSIKYIFTSFAPATPPQNTGSNNALCLRWCHHFSERRTWNPLRSIQRQNRKQRRSVKWGILIEDNLFKFDLKYTDIFANTRTSFVYIREVNPMPFYRHMMVVCVYIYTHIQIHDIYVLIWNYNYNGPLYI